MMMTNPKSIIRMGNIIPIILITLMIPMTNNIRYPVQWSMNSLSLGIPEPMPPESILPISCEEKKKKYVSQ